MKKQYSSVEVKVFLYNSEDVIRMSVQEELAQDNTKGYPFWSMTEEW